MWKCTTLPYVTDERPSGVSTGSFRTVEDFYVCEVRGKDLATVLGCVMINSAPSAEVLDDSCL